MKVRDFTGFMDFGLGIDDVNGNVRGLAVTGSKTQLTGGQTLTFICKKTESIEELHEGLGLTVDGSAAYGVFGGSEKFNLDKQSSFNHYSVFVFVHIDVRNPDQHLLGEQLVKPAADLLSAGKFDRFREEFGDLYIKGIVTGGEYWAVVAVETTDSTDQRDISNKLSGAGFFGVGGAELATTFSENFLKVTGTRSLDIVSFQAGGAGKGAKQEVTGGEVIAKAQNFASEVLQDSVAYQVELQDYTSLDIPNPPNTVDLQNAKDVMQQYGGNRATLINFLNDIAYIRNHPDQFEEFNTSDLNAIEQQVADALNTITNAASACLNDVHKCVFQASNPPSRDSLPKRKAGAPPPPELVPVPDLRGKHVDGDDAFALLIPLQLGMHPRNAIHTDDPSLNLVIK